MDDGWRPSREASGLLVLLFFQNACLRALAFPYSKGPAVSGGGGIRGLCSKPGTLGLDAAWRQTRLTVTIGAKIRCQILDGGVFCFPTVGCSGCKSARSQPPDRRRQDLVPCSSRSTEGSARGVGLLVKNRITAKTEKLALDDGRKRQVGEKRCHPFRQGDVCPEASVDMARGWLACC